MRDNEPSQTAMGTAAMRAAHRRHDNPIVFDDPLAEALTSEEFRAQLEAGEAMAMYERLGLMRVFTGVVGRARFVEDCLEAALAAGTRQYVLLGAGLDTFAWRRVDLADRLRVIEVDHPATQNYKRDRLAALDIAEPANLELLAIDFERETLDDALSRSGFDPSATTFFSWMGVVNYLTRENTLATIESVVRCSPPGSRLVFDFPISVGLLAEDGRAISRTVEEGTAALGEQRKATHDPAELRRDVEARGFRCLQELTPEQHQERYWGERRDGRRTNPQVHLIEFERTS